MLYYKSRYPWNFFPVNLLGFIYNFSLSLSLSFYLKGTCTDVVYRWYYPVLSTSRLLSLETSFTNIQIYIYTFQSSIIRLIIFIHFVSYISKKNTILFRNLDKLLKWQINSFLLKFYTFRKVVVSRHFYIWIISHSTVDWGNKKHRLNINKNKSLIQDKRNNSQKGTKPFNRFKSKVLLLWEDKRHWDYLYLL